MDVHNSRMQRYVLSDLLPGVLQTQMASSWMPLLLVEQGTSCL